MKRSPEEFQKQAAEKGLTKWAIHDCSLCGYPCGYIFHDGQVSYDSGCYCVTYYPNIQPRTWDSVVEIYEMQDNPETIKQMDEFWGFANV